MTKKPSIFVGATFAVRLRDKKYGLCRVAWTKPEWQHTSVVCLDWFGDRLPTLADAEASRPLVMQHPNYEGICWVRILRAIDTSRALEFLGTTSLTLEEASLRLGDDWHDPDQRHRSKVWKAVEQTLLREYRYRTDAGYRKKVDAAPKPGDVLAAAMPDRNGFRVCRVLRVIGRVEEDKYRTRFYVASYDAMFDARPTLAETVERLALPSPRDRSGVIATTQPPDDRWHLLGNVALSDEELDLEVNALGGWPAPRAPHEPRIARNVRATSRAVTRPSLDSVVPAELFGAWKSRVPAEKLAQSRKLLRTLVSQLRRAKSDDGRRVAIVAAVDGFNAIDSFMETTEREELCELLSALGASAGWTARASRSWSTNIAIGEPGRGQTKIKSPGTKNR